MTPDEIQQHFMANSALLYGIALSYVGCNEEAEDVVQDAFVALWQMRERLAPLSVADGLRYFKQTIRHVSIDHLRRATVRSSNKDAQQLVDAQSADESPTPLDVVATRAELTLLRKLVAALPRKQELAFSLFHFAELEISEVAIRMGESECYIRVLLARAHKTIREKYQQISQSH